MVICHKVVSSFFNSDRSIWSVESLYHSFDFHLSTSFITLYSPSPALMNSLNSCWDTLLIPGDHVDLFQPIKIGSFQFLLAGLHGLCFGYCFSCPLPLRSLTNGPLFRVRFGESVVVRLYSEIDHIHLSIEAQCVTSLLPLGDCHTVSYHFYRNQNCHAIVNGQTM